MSQILIDGVTSVSFTNGVLRIECAVAGPNNEAKHSGTLLVPAPQVATVLQSLINASQEIDKKLREHAAELTAKAEASKHEKKN